MQLLKWLSVTDRFYKIYLDKQLAPFGINNSQYMFLIKICRSPGILQDSLMDMFYVHPSNIVRTVAALEKQGMIMRSPNDKDKRTCKLYPTERALSVIDEVQTVCEKTEALLLQGFRESDKNLFIDLLIQDSGYGNKDIEYNLYNLENDIKKIIAHSNGDEILSSDVALTISTNLETNVFAMLDAVSRNRKDEAYRLLHNLMVSGEGVFRLLALISSQLELILEVKEMREAGMGLSQMQKQLGIHEFRIKKAMSVTEKYSTDRLKHVLSGAYAIDGNIKSGLLEPGLALELFIAEI